MNKGRGVSVGGTFPSAIPFLYKNTVFFGFQPHLPPQPLPVCDYLTDREQFRGKSAAGLLIFDKPGEVSGQKCWWPAKKLQTSSKKGPKTLVACSKFANHQHRSRNIRPPAATDRALRGALAKRPSSRPTVARGTGLSYWRQRHFL